MKTLSKLLPVVLLSISATTGVQTVGAAVLNEGFVINAANIDKIKADTFEGHAIGELIPERMEFIIKNFNLSLKLRRSEEIPLNQVDIENTRKYAANVKMDPVTKEISGYKAGLPFPTIDVKDPLAAYKAMDNSYYQNTYGNGFDGNYSFLFIDGDKGVTRSQLWYTNKLKMKGRVSGEPVLEDGKLVSKTLLFAKEPYDIKGLGIFTIRHDTPQLEDNWAYVKSVRRVRQLSGGSWMDSMAGSVQLNDEYDALAARPSWYPEARILRKRWILAVAHLKMPLVGPKGDPATQYPTVDLQNKPFMNPNSTVEWEPREVYEIDVKMPKEHPYSKRIMYQEVKFPRFYMAEHYDRSGEFVKFSVILTAPLKGGEGYVGTGPWQGHTYDIKRKEGFIYLANSNVTLNRAVQSSDVTLGQLEAAAK